MSGWLPGFIVGVSTTCIVGFIIAMHRNDVRAAAERQAKAEAEKPRSPKPTMKDLEVGVWTFSQNEGPRLNARRWDGVGDNPRGGRWNTEMTEDEQREFYALAERILRRTEVIA